MLVGIIAGSVSTQICVAWVDLGYISVLDCGLTQACLGAYVEVVIGRAVLFLQ